MKKFTLSLILLACVSFVFAQNYQIKDFQLSSEIHKTAKMQKDLRGTAIDNADFETWTSEFAMYGLGDMPSGWFMITGNVAAQQNSDAQNGDYAMHCENGVISNAALAWTDTLVGGLSLVGNLVTGVQGEPYTNRLESMSFYAKGELESNDTAIVVMQLFKEGEFIGGAGLFLGNADITTSYQEFSADFEYETAQVPDSAMIIVSSTGVGVFQTPIGTLTAGSYIDIDNMSFVVEDITDPLAGLSPTAWNAGNVEINNATTSGDFILSNDGVGTLTITSATDLSGTPFSTTFVAGDVSLDEGAEYTFTFDFEPTAYDTYSETFTIETNGGTVEVALSGTCNEPIAGDMDGGFETNVNDFDLTFSGWTQHDVDESATYGFQDIDFTNSGYTGSFIAFNPANTVAPMEGTEIQPHNGNRFGACFSATAPPNDDWLITPQSEEITASGELKMYVKTYADDWGLERYTVNISTTGTAIEDFTKISTGEYVEAPVEEWTEVTYDLSAYAGEQIYVGIQCVTNDAFIFMVDDIEINEFVSINDNSKNQVSVYPNPANNVLTIENAQGAAVSVFNMLGQELLHTTVKDNMQTLNVSELPEGTYVVRIANGAEVKTQKLNIVR